MTGIAHGFCAIGFTQPSTRSMNPPEKPKPIRTGSIALTAMEMPVNSAWTTYRPGARNMKENSSGSVTPTKKEAIALESSTPAATLRRVVFAETRVPRAAASPCEGPRRWVGASRPSVGRGSAERGGT